MSYQIRALYVIKITKTRVASRLDQSLYSRRVSTRICYRCIETRNVFELFSTRLVSRVENFILVTRQAARLVPLDVSQMNPKQSVIDFLLGRRRTGGSLPFTAFLHTIHYPYISMPLICTTHAIYNNKLPITRQAYYPY